MKLCDPFAILSSGERLACNNRTAPRQLARQCSMQDFDKCVGSLSQGTRDRLLIPSTQIKRFLASTHVDEFQISCQTEVL